MRPIGSSRDFTQAGSSASASRHDFQGGGECLACAVQFNLQSPVTSYEHACALAWLHAVATSTALPKGWTASQFTRRSAGRVIFTVLQIICNSPGDLIASNTSCQPERITPLIMQFILRITSALASSLRHSAAFYHVISTTVQLV